MKYIKEFENYDINNLYFFIRTKNLRDIKDIPNKDIEFIETTG